MTPTDPMIFAVAFVILLAAGIAARGVMWVLDYFERLRAVIDHLGIGPNDPEEDHGA